LPEGQGNYSFLLSAQGRIQGDCFVYRRADDILLDTGRDQAPAVISHLDHFIIMDDVELADVSQEWTALALKGPKASQVLGTLGFASPKIEGDHALMHSMDIGEVACTLIEKPSHYEVWFAPEHVLAVWETLQAAGAIPCGLEAVEGLRVYEGLPLYGVDIQDRDLPQETGQKRALNFNKGCYLGQEIVERIRSRGKVNRQLQQFALQGAPAALPAELRSEGQPVGRITSVASVPGAGLFGLGLVRVEPVERNAAITYDGGTAVPTGK
jgi:folate-binding protein YgfZ